MNGPPRGPGASPGALLALEDGRLYAEEALGALGTVTVEV